MPVRKSAVTASLLIVSALGLALGTVTNPSNPAIQQERFGRFTSHDVIALTQPVIEAILPNRNDLYVVTEHRSSTAEDGTFRNVWILDYTDEAGNPIIHITRDADTGEIAWLGYDWHLDQVSPHPVSLTPRSAANQAQQWMRILGFHANWQFAGSPQRHARPPRSMDADWSVVLQKPGWRAQLVMNETAGTLIYANVVPTRNAPP